MHHSPTDASLGEANSTATTLEMARSSVPATSPLESFHYGLKVAACLITPRWRELMTTGEVRLVGSTTPRNGRDAKEASEYLKP